MSSLLTTIAGLNTLGLEDAEAAQGATIGISTTSPTGSTILGASGTPQTGTIILILGIVALVWFLNEEGKRKR